MSSLSFYIYQFIPIVLIEAIAMWKTGWGPFRRCLLDSLMMNFVPFLGLLLGIGPYITSSRIFGLMLFATYSVIIEGVVLVLLERHHWKKVISTVAIANGCSFAMLGFVSILDWISFGGLFR